MTPYSNQQHKNMKKIINNLNVCICIPNHACVQDTCMWVPTKLRALFEDG